MEEETGRIIHLAAVVVFELLQFLDLLLETLNAIPVFVDNLDKLRLDADQLGPLLLVEHLDVDLLLQLLELVLYIVF